MYLGLEKPWQRAEPAPVAAEAEVVPAKEEPTKKGKRRKPARHSNNKGEELEGRDDGDFEESAPPVELTAADRKLVWRGPEVVLPPAKVDFGEGGNDARSLSDAEIQGAVRDGSRPIIDCMVTSATGTNLRATVTLKMLVDGKGQVTRHRVQAPQYLFDHGIAACVDRAVSRLRFPATGAPTLVTAPFDLG